ncbi:MAG: hypothetical protein KGH61_02800 [Candidatus Micrarchaeota archaeon]|nr:hypothetical protein [Candidatus Micrarchaeota archaeon]MDE1847853.1 hypothetical protein [Candidatus Micrarchaeota archaeon]MDE1864180.1 hypothetical protein [Candidatus Micrarchaeota archaeon]
MEKRRASREVEALVLDRIERIELFSQLGNCGHAEGFVKERDRLVEAYRYRLDKFRYISYSYPELTQNLSQARATFRSLITDVALHSGIAKQFKELAGEAGSKAYEKASSLGAFAKTPITGVGVSAASRFALDFMDYAKFEAVRRVIESPDVMMQIRVKLQDIKYCSGYQFEKYYGDRLTVDNPFEPLIRMYESGLCPLGFDEYDRDFVFHDLSRP